jgi:hypothetical protein
MIVSVGFAPVAVGNGEPSTTYKLSTTCARHQRLRTEVEGLSPIRAVPC